MRTAFGLTIAGSAFVAGLLIVLPGLAAWGPAQEHVTPMTAKATPDAVRYSKSGYDITRLDEARIEALASDLTTEERTIILRKGTEPAFCGTLLDNKQEGTYTCRLCALPLFSSDAKFKSGTGWPSFHSPFDSDHIAYIRDTSHGMVRTEILCARCGGHLGHVFEDGPRPTGLRYCLNSASLQFADKESGLPEASRPVEARTAYFGGGCFWGVEDAFQQVPGVIDAVSGYQGGTTEAPTYKQVCTGSTGHAEVVRVTFDPARVSYERLLDVFFRIHDPTQLNRQGPDIGTQYRSVIFAADADQAAQARAFIERLTGQERYKDRRIVTAVESATAFFEAESYHQDYHARHGGSCAIPD